MAYRYMKNCSISLIIKEIKIKNTKRYYVTLVRLTIIKKNQEIKAVMDMYKMELIHTVGEKVNWCSHSIKKSMEVPQKK